MSAVISLIVTASWLCNDIYRAGCITASPTVSMPQTWRALPEAILARRCVVLASCHHNCPRTVAAVTCAGPCSEAEGVSELVDRVQDPCQQMTTDCGSDRSPSLSYIQPLAGHITCESVACRSGMCITVASGAVPCETVGVNFRLQRSDYPAAADGCQTSDPHELNLQTVADSSNISEQHRMFSVVRCMVCSAW